MAKKLMKGNEAMAEAAIQAGCQAFFGYPITPQSEIPEYFARELPKRGGTFLQAESEMASRRAMAAARMRAGVFFMCKPPSNRLTDGHPVFLFFITFSRTNSSRSFSSRASVIRAMSASSPGRTMFFSALARFCAFFMA